MEPPGQPSFYREGALKPKEKQSCSLFLGLDPTQPKGPQGLPDTGHTHQGRAALKAGTGSQMPSKKQTKFSLFL